MKRVSVVIAITILACSILSGVAAAQAVASISGTVMDQTGAAIPNASVSATDQGTNLARSVSTDTTGHYVITPLPIGVYKVVATAGGFQRTENRGVVLEVQQARTIDFKLQPSAVSTEVTVESQVSQVEVQRSDATLGQIIHANQVSELPLNGRNFVQLALLGTGTTQGRAATFLNQGSSSEVSFRGSMALSAQGMRENSNDWLYDGIDNNELTAGGIGILPSIDAIQEFRVMTFNYSAQYGSRGGTTVLVSSKSGTNKFHGSLFEFLRNDVLDARNFFDGTKKGKYIQNEFGGALGGPLLKNKTFFFGDIQANRVRQGLTILSTVPTKLEKQGIFTESFPGAAAVQIYDPTTTTIVGGIASRQPFQGNVIPLTKQSAIGRAIVNLYPDPTFTDRLASNYLSNPVKQLNDMGWNFRLDHNFNANDRAFGRFSWDNAQQFSPSGLPGFGAASAFASSQTFRTHSRNVGVSETHILSPTTINTLTLGYNRVFNYITSIGYGSNESQQLGIPGANLGTPETSEMTQISVTGFNPIGDRQFSPFQGGTDVYHYSDALDLVRGRHSIHGGFTFRAMQENTLGDNAFAGAFTFDRLFTAGFTPTGALISTSGNAIASLLMGIPTSGSRNDELNGFKRGRRWKEYRGFFQDDWTVLPRLTLNLGLAYEVTTPMTEAANRFSSFDPQTGTIYVGGPFTASGSFPAGGATRLVANSPSVGVSTDYSGVEPRIAFAWSPFGGQKTVIRGGYGLFHDVSSQGGTQGPYTNPPYSNFYSFTSDNITPVRTLATGFPANQAPADPATYAGAWRAWDPRFRIGLFEQWNLNVQRELPGSTVVTVAYAGSHGMRLMQKNFDFNSAPPGPGVNTKARRPYPQYSNVFVTDSHGWMRYDSLQLKAERRTSKGLYLLAAYTWSKALSNGLKQEITGDPGQDYYPILPSPQADKGYAGTDLRHNFTFSYLYQLPFGKGQRWLTDLPTVADAILGGWELNGILLAHSGFALGFNTSSNLSGTGIGNRPNMTCGGTLSGNQQVFSKWFDTSCFVAPAAGVLGTSPRTPEVYGPDQVNFDSSLYKNFRITEGSKLQFRSEFFNLFNHTQLSIPNTTVGNVNFGRITATAHSSRQVQFALKYVF
jgi:hypothetical protein